VKYKKENAMDKQKETGKKLWSKPELTVLVRNKPEEAVLTGCKTEVSGDEMHREDVGCFTIQCDECSESSAS
jgi:hypothetical protein